MPNYRRVHHGDCYFFTVVTHQRQRILVRDDVRRALREAIRHVRLTLPFEIDAFVLLPDHLHCIWRLPDGDTDYALRWRLIKTLVTQQSGGGIWQKRYWEHRIRDDLDFERHVDYIHFNPVKHKLVKAVADWPHSSFHRYVQNGVLPRDWAGKGDDGKFGE